MSEPHPSHKTVAVLTAFTMSVLNLHQALKEALNPYEPDDVSRNRDRIVVVCARNAVRAARCLTVREEYR